MVSLSGLLEHNTTDWVAYTQQTLIAHSLEAGKSKVKVLADLLSGKSLLSGS